MIQFPSDSGWKLLNAEDASCERVIDTGIIDGALVHTALVLLGGNGRWTAIYLRHAKGRMKQRGSGRIASKCLASDMPPQFTHCEDARKWCDQRMLQAQTELAPLP